MSPASVTSLSGVNSTIFFHAFDDEEYVHMMFLYLPTFLIGGGSLLYSV